MVIFIEIDINKIDNDYVLIDIRDEAKYKEGHFRNSINILPLHLIIEPEKYLSKKRKYLLICEYGIKSKKTSMILNNMGYHTFSLIDGIKSMNKRN